MIRPMKTLFLITLSALLINACGDTTTDTDTTPAADTTAAVDTTPAPEDTATGENPQPPWNDVCTTDEDCAAPTDFCAKQPTQTEGYCTIHCTGAADCVDSTWGCNAFTNCQNLALTWCGPASEIEEGEGMIVACE